jgi:hypothetical protein
VLKLLENRKRPIITDGNAAMLHSSNENLLYIIRSQRSHSRDAYAQNSKKR